MALNEFDSMRQLFNRENRLRVDAEAELSEANTRIDTQSKSLRERHQEAADMHLTIRRLREDRTNALARIVDVEDKRIKLLNSSAETIGGLEEALNISKKDREIKAQIIDTRNETIVNMRSSRDQLNSVIVDLKAEVNLFSTNKHQLQRTIDDLQSENSRLSSAARNTGRYRELNQHIDRLTVRHQNQAKTISSMFKTTNDAIATSKLAESAYEALKAITDEMKADMAKLEARNATQAKMLVGDLSAPPVKTDCVFGPFGGEPTPNAAQRANEIVACVNDKIRQETAPLKIAISALEERVDEIDQG